MRVRKIENQQRELALLVKYAATVNAIDYAALDDDRVDELLGLADGAANLLLEKEEVIRLTALVQASVKLPAYSTRQAAAWLGYSVRGLAHAIYSGRLVTLKPGHDLVISHQELERFALAPS